MKESLDQSKYPSPEKLRKQRWYDQHREEARAYHRAYYAKRHPGSRSYVKADAELSQESPESSESLEGPKEEKQKAHTGGRPETSVEDLIKSFEGFYTFYYWASENIGIYRACLKRPDLMEIAERHFKRIVKTIIWYQRP